MKHRSASEVARQVRSRERSAVEIVRERLAAITAGNNPINAVVRAEARILGGNHGTVKIWRHLIKPNPILVEAIAGKQPQQLQVCDGWRHDAINQCHHNGPGKHAAQNAQAPALPGHTL